MPGLREAVRDPRGRKGRTPTRCPACRAERLKKQWAQAAERQRFKKGCRRYGSSRLDREQKAARAESLAQFDKACPRVAEVVIDRGNGVRTIVRGRVTGSPWQAANTLRIAAGR